MTPRRTHRHAGALLLVAVVVLAALVSPACSRDRGVLPPGADATTTTAPDGSTAPDEPTQGGPSATDPPGPSTTGAPARPAPPTSIDATAALQLAWVRQVGGLGSDEVTGVTGRDATVVAVGSTEGLRAPAPGGRDVMVAVVGTDGTPRALEQQGGDAVDRATGVADGGAGTLACGTAGGSFSGLGGGDTDGWCGPVEDSGRLGEVNALGSDNDDALTGVAAVPTTGPTGGPAVGYTVGTTNGVLADAEDPFGRGLGDGDAVVARVDVPDGETRWVRQFGSFTRDRATAVSTTADGDAVVAGTTVGDLAGQAQGGADGWVARFDPSGNPRWSVQVGTAANEDLRATASAGEARRGDERFYAAGSTGGRLGRTAAGGTDAVVVALGPNGDRDWTTQWGAAGTDEAVAMVADGRTLLVAGTTDGPLGTLRTDLGPGGGRDAFVSAVDAATGRVLFTGRFGTSGRDEVTSLTTTEDGLVVVGGTTDGTFTGATSAGGTDGFLVAFRLPGGGGGAASSV